MTAVSKFGLRKKHTKKESKYSHKLKLCPIPGCGAVTKNPGEHFRSKKHQIFNKGSTKEKYQRLLKEAKLFDPSLMPTQTDFSPTKDLGIVCKYKRNPKPQESRRALEASVTPQVSRCAPEATATPPQVSRCAPEASVTPQVSRCAPEATVTLQGSRRVQAATVASQVSGESESDSGSSEFGEYEEEGKCCEQVEQSFHNYMTGPDRGRKVASVTGVVQDVRRVLLAVNAHYDINHIYDINTDTLRQKYLNEHCKAKEMRPSSIRKYLYSLIDFSKFLKSTNAEFVNQKLVKTTITNLKLWRKNYSRQAKKETNQTRQEDYQMLVTPTQVRTYMESNHSKSASQLFKTLKQDPNYDLSHTEYCICRDHLFVIIHFSNACRSGVTVNMTIEEYNKARHVPEKGGYIIEVQNHKTDFVYGPAQVFFTDYDFEMLQIFVNHARAQVSTTNNTVFLSWTGRSLASGDVSKRLHCLWKMAGNFEGKQIPKNLSVNITRKSASTGIRESTRSQFKPCATQ